MLSEKPWKPDAVLLLGMGVMLSLMAGWLVNLAVQLLVPEGLPIDPNLYTFVVNTVSFQVGALILITIFLRHHYVRWKEFLGLGLPGWWNAIGWGLVMGLAVLPFALGLNMLSLQLISLTEVKPELQVPIKILQVSVTLTQRMAFVFSAVILAPIVEESLFRGILYPLIKQLGFPKTALWGTSLLFALIHGNLMTFVPLTFLALVLTAIYERTDRLIASIATHATFNICNFFILIYEAPLSRWLSKFYQSLRF
jgi:membrane protease YdiL (CAAX protease family)